MVWWCVVQLDAVVAYGRLGGRLDHMFANIDTLYTAAREAPGLPVYLVDEENIACLLNKVQQSLLLRNLLITNW